MKKRIKVLIVEPGKAPKVRCIKNSLERMQKIVGGYIEEIDISDEAGVVAIGNEEGKLMGLAYNRALFDRSGKLYDVIAGTFFLCYASPESEEFMSLTKEHIEKYKKRFSLPDIITI